MFGTNCLPLSRQQAVRRATCIESLESRQLKSVSYSSGATNSDLDGTYFGEVLYGDNGDVSGFPTAVSGASDSEYGWTNVQWDSSPYDGIDSGYIGVQFVLNSDGNHHAQFEVDGNNAGTFGLSSSQAVHSVTIRSEVTGGGLAFDWSNVQIDFYHAGSVVESVNINDLHANTLTSTNNDPAESYAVVTPSASGVDGVRVAGVVRLRANEGVSPGWTDLVGQVFVT